jgi:hypothetical protein
MGKELNNKNTYDKRYLIRLQTARFLLAKLRLLSEKSNFTYKKEEKYGGNQNKCLPLHLK